MTPVKVIEATIDNRSVIVMTKKKERSTIINQVNPFNSTYLASYSSDSHLSVYLIFNALKETVHVLILAYIIHYFQIQQLSFAHIQFTPIHTK